jgi:tetratricopeptide (TPR) repeat protein
LGILLVSFCSDFNTKSEIIPAMALTPLTDSLRDSPQFPEFALDLAGSRLSFGERVVDLTPKALALVGLLTLARLLDYEGDRSCWVTPEEVATAPEWDSERSVLSLRAQIRREIKRLAKLGIDVIDARDGELLKGPFRLKVFPTRNWRDLDRLVKRFGPGMMPTSQTPEGLFQWLEAAEPVWRTAYYFDKPGEVLSDAVDLACPDERHGPIAASVAFITRARRLREMGENAEAEDALKHALAALKAEKNTNIRSHLEASCYLQQGWLDYRRKRFVDAERSVQIAMKVLDGHPHLTVRGKIFSLRSLLRRRRKRFDDALQDLRRASECWLVEVDLYGLFSVFHNLSCLLSEQASYETDHDRRQALLKQAIVYCQKSKDYCHQYKLGQNSVMSTIQLASLYTRTGDAEKAMVHADEAFEEAKEKDNRSEALMAHYHRVRIRLWKGNFAEADAIQEHFLKDIGTHPYRTRIDERYQEMRRQAVAKPGDPPTTTRANE